VDQSNTTGYRDLGCDSIEGHRQCKKLEVRTQNEKATDILLGGIEAGSKAEDVAFSIVSKTMKPADGYVSGDFKKAWTIMIRKYEDTDTVSRAD
jgi:succinyl-CoA synthetase alpha subunit